MEVSILSERNPVEYTGKILDQRNDLTAPENLGERSALKRPKHVPIQDYRGKKRNDGY